MMTPFATILIAADNSYPGLVTRQENDIVFVTWYKWGFHAPDVIEDWDTAAHAETCIISEAECNQRFGALPPQYQPIA